jgi:hypothetical protein
MSHKLCVTSNFKSSFDFYNSAIVSVLIPLTGVTSTFQQFIKAFILVARVTAFSKYVVVKYYAKKTKNLMSLLTALYMFQLFLWALPF